MEQKDYMLEIVGLLLKGGNHIRELARQININHMTISRKVKELLNKNVIDFRQEGKNKVYFLKKTCEAKAYVFMSEEYKLLKLLESYPNLRKIIENIQKNKKIHLTIIFGSYAKGLAQKNSDIDIYVETMSNKIKKDIELLDSKISLKIGKFSKSSLLVREIEKNHIIIKGVEIFYERNKFFD